jgi:hypothetical protein
MSNSSILTANQTSDNLIISDVLSVKSKKKIKVKLPFLKT